MAATACPFRYLGRLLHTLSSPSNYGLRRISTSLHAKGLEEFFPAGVYESGGPGPKEVKTGRRWHASDLRLKSNNDLHKLWYVLLKEMNMLQTVKAEAQRLQVPMPNPERINKVRKSMAMIKVVIGERERAVQKLSELGYTSAIQEDEALQERDLIDSEENSSESIDEASKNKMMDNENGEVKTNINEKSRI